MLDHGFQQVHLHRLQIAAHRSIFGVLLRQRRQQWLQGQGNGFFIQLAQLVVRLALPLRQAGQLFVQSLFQFGNILVEAFAIGFRQLREFGFVQRLAIAHRREGHVAAVAIQRHAFFQGQALDHIQGAVITLIETAIDRAFALLISRVFEHGREGCQQVVDQMVDIANKSARATGRQFQGSGLAGFVKVVDVDPVARRLQALALGLEVAFDEREATRTRLAHDKYVVTRARHGHAELQGFDRTFLAENAAERFQIIGVREAELFSRKRTG